MRLCRFVALESDAVSSRVCLRCALRPLVCTVLSAYCSRRDRTVVAAARSDKLAAIHPGNTDARRRITGNTDSPGKHTKYPGNDGFHAKKSRFYPEIHIAPKDKRNIRGITDYIRTIYHISGKYRIARYLYEISGK